MLSVDEILQYVSLVSSLFQWLVTHSKNHFLGCVEAGCSHIYKCGTVHEYYLIAPAFYTQNFQLYVLCTNKTLTEAVTVQTLTLNCELDLDTMMDSCRPCRVIEEIANNAPVSTFLKAFTCLCFSQNQRSTCGSKNVPQSSSVSRQQKDAAIASHVTTLEIVADEYIPVTIVIVCRLL